MNKSIYIACVQETNLGGRAEPPRLSGWLLACMVGSTGMGSVGLPYTSRRCCLPCIYTPGVPHGRAHSLSFSVGDWSVLAPIKSRKGHMRRGLVQLVSEIFHSQVFRAATFGERPRQAADAHLLAGSQHRCSVGRADALKACLRSVGIFHWKDW